MAGVEQWYRLARRDGKAELGMQHVRARSKGELEALARQIFAHQWACGQLHVIPADPPGRASPVAP